MAADKESKALKLTQSYSYPNAKSLLRPDVGTQPNFPRNKRKKPKEYRYDSSLSPVLEWDDNPTREQAEVLIAEISSEDSMLIGKLVVS